MRKLDPGMGQAVAKRTVLRKVEGEWESWGDVADRVAAGNVSLAPGGIAANMQEFAELRDHIAEGRILMSGRHLQHGDMQQKFRNMEVFTNCATACTSALSYHLLLNGSGVGRCYDDDMMVVDWDKAPKLCLFLDQDHPDREDADDSMYLDWSDEGLSFKQTSEGSWELDEDAVFHEVDDSREGWAKALEIYETMTYLEQSDKVLVLDFSNVRPSGAPIGGMQGRPSSGPVPTMQAFKNIRDNVVGKGMPKWKQAMYVDHYMAESVLVGGARRAARIAVKYWKDPDILDYISIKQGGVLWSANNSVGVDEEFWDLLNDPRNFSVTEHPPILDQRSNRTLHVSAEAGLAFKVFNAITEAAYHDGTGEPGFLNLHKLNTNEEGWDWEVLKKGEYVGSKKYQVETEYKQLLGEIASRVEHKQHKFIVNPCGEIVLSVLGGFCVIADVVPYHCKDQEEFTDVVRHAVRSLIRVNTMDSIYRGEVLRTNRIGVGCTGLHEHAWDGFRVSFLDSVDSVRDSEFSKWFWFSLQSARGACEVESEDYSRLLGVSPPHTCTTIKPAGTTSKLFGLTEGCHLPAMTYYLRWVQKRSDDPLVQEYIDKGYPHKVLETYAGMTAIGFPTKPAITDLIPEDKLVTAGEATMDEQFRWLQLLEEHWLGPDKGNQLSYTLKYKPDEVSFEEFQQKMLEWVPKVRCVSVMPQVDMTAYEYQPEEPITREQFEEYMAHIEQTQEDISREHVECGAGGCPIDFSEGDK